MKKIRWMKIGDGVLYSESSRFRIGHPYVIKGGCIVMNKDGSGYHAEQRIVLSDRCGIKDGVMQEVGYLCLNVEHAKDLAEDLVCGKGVLAQ